MSTCYRYPMSQYLEEILFAFVFIHKRISNKQLQLYTTLPKVFVHLKIASVVFGHLLSKLLFEKKNGDFISIYINFHMLG